MCDFEVVKRVIVGDLKPLIDLYNVTLQPFMDQIELRHTLQCQMLQRTQ